MAIIDLNYERLKLRPYVDFLATEQMWAMFNLMARLRLRFLKWKRQQ